MQILEQGSIVFVCRNLRNDCRKMRGKISRCQQTKQSNGTRCVTNVLSGFNPVEIVKKPTTTGVHRQQMGFQSQDSLGHPLRGALFHHVLEPALTYCRSSITNDLTVIESCQIWILKRGLIQGLDGSACKITKGIQRTAQWTTPPLMIVLTHATPTV